jgi:HTH-type transcriptional regulator/antitoxin HigA
MTARGSTTLDPIYYAQLLKDALPRVVHTEQQNERLLRQVEKLLAKGEGNLSLEEEELLELLTQIIEAFERTAYTRKKASPAELVSFLLVQRGLTARDLWPVLGSKSRVSDLVNGKRQVSREQAKKLGEFFHISPAAFI